VLKTHCRWLQENPGFIGLSVDSILREVTSDDILEWIIAQRASGISETTINNREVLTKGFYGFLTTSQAQRARQDTPWGRTNITSPQHSNLPRFVTMEQVIRLLKGVHNESQRVALHCMYDTGVRVSELARLTNNLLPNERDWPEEVNYYPLLVPGSKCRLSQEYKFRWTIISRPVLARIRRYHATTDYLLSKHFRLSDPTRPVFLNVHGERLSKDSIQNAITDAWLRQGGGPREISPHRLRHGTAFSILQSEFGKDLYDNLLILKNIFGHVDVKSTEIYAAIPIAALRSIQGVKEVRLKYDEAQQIYDVTYLPQKLHYEKRGHRK
jgi:integrase/recombinase XerC